ncbi:MAG TPA: alanyl-tRNA editing protein [Myxococcota bacterium]|nr:alanyl-tRNA editing protein [Myxococcota bacterium]HRY96543.1 alanyl-tRNA editing protein [Myxococcota bacterium]HSA23956.1 alanyl-tRNA editing protein [Myxococcota bacterium]
MDAPRLNAYQRDAHLTSLRARAVACAPAQGGFLVELEDTLFYPEGGGQPADAGTLDGQALLGLQKTADGRVLHLLAEAVEVGREVALELDWARRLDHMQQHSAQHILTALALAEFGWPTTAFHLGPDRSDLELGQDGLDLAALAGLQARANEIVRQARPVRTRWVSAEEFQTLPVRSRILPEGFAGPYRLVEIEGVDLNTCGGTHVASTAELQAVALTGTERLRGGTRVFFLAGGRVLRELGQAVAHQRALGELLSCPPADHPAAVSRLQAELREAGVQRRQLQSELALHLARELSRGPQPASLHRPEADMACLQAVARAFLELCPQGLALLTGKGLFVLAGPADRLKALGPQVAAALGGRGGGGAGLYQGKAAELSPAARERALATLRSS